MDKAIIKIKIIMLRKEREEKQVRIDKDCLILEK
jgi:hypothetical protein